VPRAASRRSREQWCELVAAWRRSGQTCAGFARAHGLNLNTFAWWRSELARSSPTPLTLVPVSGRPDPVASEPLEVVLRNGLTVRVPERADISWVARLVHALGAR
jgi:transposase-like protein